MNLCPVVFSQALTGHFRKFLSLPYSSDEQPGWSRKLKPAWSTRAMGLVSMFLVAERQHGRILRVLQLMRLSSLSAQRSSISPVGSLCLRVRASSRRPAILAKVSAEAGADGPDEYINRPKTHCLSARLSTYVQRKLHARSDGPANHCSICAMMPLHRCDCKNYARGGFVAGINGPRPTR